MAHGISQEKLDEIGLEPEQVSGTYVINFICGQYVYKIHYFHFQF